MFIIKMEDKKERLNQGDKNQTRRCPKYEKRITLHRNPLEKPNI